MVGVGYDAHASALSALIHAAFSAYSGGVRRSRCQKTVGQAAPIRIGVVLAIRRDPDRMIVDDAGAVAGMHFLPGDAFAGSEIETIDRQTRATRRRT